MALGNIVKKGDGCLNKNCREVKDFNNRLHKLLDDMRETLLESNGVGLAAPQVGVLRRVVLVMDTNNDDVIIELINPEIVEVDGEQEGPEGCLSVPGIHEKVTRPKRIRVQYLDENMQEHDEWVEGFLARAMQHEFDHLEGKVFVDRLSPLRRQMNKNRLMNLLRGKAQCTYKTKRTAR